jgi:hypothetical protein
MRPQKGESQHSTPTTLVWDVCASQSGFQPITRDLGSCPKKPSFALSRRQRGFESRWEHKVKTCLTRPDTTASRSASRIYRQGRARDAGAPASATFSRAPQQPTFARPTPGAASVGGLVLLLRRVFRQATFKLQGRQGSLDEQTQPVVLLELAR